MTQKKLVELNNKILRIKKGSQSYRNIHSQIEELVLSALEQNDSSVQLLIEENRQFLANNDIKFKVYQEGGSYFGTHATKLKGTMHKNGYVDVESCKMMMPFIPFDQSMYPTEFKGQTKGDGSIDLKVPERNFALFGSKVPEEFLGNIDIDGNVTIRMIKSSFEWSGEHYIHKLLFDPFKGNEQKRSRFIDNTIFLKKKVRTYIEEHVDHQSPT